MSQKEQIRKYLQEGHKITPLESLSQFGCFRLAAVIHRLKNEGMRIKSKLVKVNSRSGKPVSQYWL